MIMRQFIISLVLSGFIITGMGACAPMKNTRGNIVKEDRLANITPNVSKKADVTAVLGTPTTVAPFDKNTWYYIGEKTETTAFFQPEVVERTVLTIKFDDNDTVTAMDQLDESAANNIESVDAKTPTSGQEMNAFQQFIGNLGKFNQQGGDTNVGTGM